MTAAGEECVVCANATVNTLPACPSGVDVAVWDANANVIGTRRMESGRSGLSWRFAKEPATNLNRSMPYAII